MNSKWMKIVGVLVVIAAVGAFAYLRLFNEPWVKTGDDPNRTVVLHFPAETSMGRLDAHGVHRVQGEVRVEKIPARGDVEVKNWWSLTLSLGPRALPDMSSLEALPPETLVGLAARFDKFEDAHLQPFVKQKGIKKIDLARSGITDTALATLAEFPELERLILRDTAITDEGLTALAKVKSLAFVDLRGTNVTPAGIGRFRSQLPITIYHD